MATKDYVAIVIFFGIVGAFLGAIGEQIEGGWNSVLEPGAPRRTWHVSPLAGALIGALLAILWALDNVWGD